MRSFAARFDAVALAIALVAGAVVFIIQEGPVLALLSAASVLVVGLVAETILHRLKRSADTLTREWHAPLTRHQAEVALLVSEGLTNKEIAARLGIGERGAEANVFTILNKLEFHNRTQIGVWIREKQRHAGPGPSPMTATKKSVPR